MKNVFSKLLVLMIAACVCRADALSAQGCPVKAGQQMIAKDHSEKVDHDLIIKYTPTSQAADGTWRLVVIGPDGRKHEHSGSKHIDVRNPTNNGIHPAERVFKIEKPLHTGVYTLSVELIKKNGTAPIDMTTLAQNITISGKNDKVMTTIPAGFFTGNTAAVSKGECAQLTYTYYNWHE